MGSDKVIAAVKSGGVRASLAILDLLRTSSIYPGDISDISKLTQDDTIADFIPPTSAFAWCYLAIHGISEYDGDDPYTKSMVAASLDGSLWEDA